MHKDEDESSKMAKIIGEILLIPVVIIVTIIQGLYIAIMNDYRFPILVLVASLILHKILTDNVSKTYKVEGNEEYRRLSISRPVVNAILRLEDFLTVDAISLLIIIVLDVAYPDLGDIIREMYFKV